MKVLHVTNNFPTESNPIFGIFVKEQVESLLKKGLESEVFFINGREKGKFEYLRSIRTIRKKLNDNRYDIIHCHHALSALVLILSGAAKKNKVIVSFQNDPVYELGTKIGRYIINNSNGWIFKNKSSFIENKNAFYLPNGVNLDFFRPIDKKTACRAVDLDPEKTYILFVSSSGLRQQKRYDRFKATLENLRKDRSDIQEIQLINEKRELIPFYLNATDVHLMTSDFEGSPNSVKECMACNTSVVSTDVGNVKELLDGVQGSYVAESTDIDELATLVCKSLENVEEKNGRDMILSKKLDIESVAEDLLDIYQKIYDQEKIYT